MKTEIEIWNGGGWNNYAALRNLNSVKLGSRGLASKQGIKKIEISPKDSERPYGIAARYFDAEGELIFTQGFDQNDSAEYIRDCVYGLLAEGIQNRINQRAKAIAREDFVKKITAWRRNFDQKEIRKSAVPLRNKFGALRAAQTTNRMSRKQCWVLTEAVRNGTMTYKEAVAKFSK